MTEQREERSKGETGPQGGGIGAASKKRRHKEAVNRKRSYHL